MTILAVHVGRDLANGGLYYSCEAQREPAVVSAHSVLCLSRDLKDMLDRKKITFQFSFLLKMLTFD